MLVSTLSRKKEKSDLVAKEMLVSTLSRKKEKKHFCGEGELCCELNSVEFACYGSY